MITINNMTKGNACNNTSKAFGSRFSVLLLAVMLLVAMCMGPATALAGTVSYEGKEGGIVLDAEDLFENFKDVVPGDSLSDSVNIENNGDNKAKIYLRAKGTGGATDFLKQVKLTVTQSGGKKVFDAAANEKAGLTDWVLLGTLNPGSSTTLNLTLNAPIEMGNEYQDKEGTVEWQFKAEEFESSKKVKKSKAKTGDDISMGLAIGLLAGALAIMTIAAVLGKRRKE